MVIGTPCPVSLGLIPPLYFGIPQTRITEFLGCSYKTEQIRVTHWGVEVMPLAEMNLGTVKWAQ